MANDFFCLELGDNYLRVADGEVSSKKIDLISLGSEIIPLTFFTNQNEKTIDEAAKAVEKLINNLKIQKKNVNIIIPDIYSFSQIVSMPNLKEKELLSAIKYQADQFIPLPIDDAALDLDILYEDKEKKSLLILIVAAASNLIDIVSRIVEKVGLIPQNIENEVSAVSRLINTIYKDQQNKQPLIFINFGYYSTSLYFYHPQLNLITNIYNFKIGFDLFSREVQINFNFDKLKANEALKTIGFTKTGSVDLEGVLKPVFNEFIAEIEKFIISIKEKEKLTTVNRLLSFNLSNQINFFNKALDSRLGTTSNQFDLSPIIANNPNLVTYKQFPSAFTSVIGGNIR